METILCSSRKLIRAGAERGVVRHCYATLRWRGANLVRWRGAILVRNAGKREKDVEFHRLEEGIISLALRQIL